MPYYETSILIAAPQEAVWSVLSAVAAWPQWLPTVTDVKPLDETHLRIGARYTILQPKLRPATWVVTTLQAPRRFVWEARSPGARLVANHVVEPDSTGSTKVTLSMSFSGLLGSLVGRLYRGLTKSYIAREAAALKHKVESSGAAEA